jgi:hypothetical protein
MPKQESLNRVQEQARKQVRDLNSITTRQRSYSRFPVRPTQAISGTNGLTRLPRRSASRSRKYPRPP